jgi:hypothetical protein
MFRNCMQCCVFQDHAIPFHALPCHALHVTHPTPSQADHAIPFEMLYQAQPMYFRSIIACNAVLALLALQGLAMPWHVLPCQPMQLYALPCHALPCDDMRCHCPATSSHAHAMPCAAMQRKALL